MRALATAAVAAGLSFAAAVSVATPAAAQVTFERLRSAASEPGNWLTYSGTYRSQRYSTLDQIKRDNVKDLELKWVFQAQYLDPYESTPLVVDGILYTMQGNDAVALDAATGRLFWMYRYNPSTEARMCCGRISRGLAPAPDRQGDQGSRHEHGHSDRHGGDESRRGQRRDEQRCSPKRPARRDGFAALLVVHRVGGEGGAQSLQRPCRDTRDRQGNRGQRP